VHFFTTSFASMTHCFTTRLAAGFLGLLANASAHAGRPMVVDDATIVDPGMCQLEAWTQRPQGQDEAWAVPSCRIGAWELGAGIGRIRPGAGAAYHAQALQAKTVFRPLQPNGWAVGLTIADQYRFGGSLDGDVSVLVPLTVSLLDDRVRVHANAGWTRLQATRRGGALWALGAEWAVRAPLTLTLETYGTQHGHAYAQAGMSVQVIPDRLALDAGLGQRVGRAGLERYATVGLTYAAPVLR
jgi:hypothetical protein